MSDKSTWGIRSMPESARRLALSNAAALGLSIADFLVKLIMEHNSTPSVGVGQDEALRAVLHDRITSLEADLASRQSVLVIEGMASSLESLEAMAADMLNRIVALEEIVAGQQQSTLAGVLERGLLSGDGVPVGGPAVQNAPACGAAIVENPPNVTSADSPAWFQTVSDALAVIPLIHPMAGWKEKADGLNLRGILSPRGLAWTKESLRSWCRRNPVAS